MGDRSADHGQRDSADVFGICTHIERADLQDRQILIRDEEPLLYHTGTLEEVCGSAAPVP